jgi:hypothetical protein
MPRGRQSSKVTKTYKKKSQYKRKPATAVKKNYNLNQSNTEILNPQSKDKTIVMKFTTSNAKVMKVVGGSWTGTNTGTTFRFSDLGTIATSLKAVYRKYKLLNIRMKWYVISEDQTGQVDPYLLQRYSYNNDQIGQGFAGSINVQEFKNLQNVMRFRFDNDTKQCVYDVKPRIMNSAYATSVVADTSYTTKPKWIGTEDDSILHYGYIALFENLPATTSQLQIQLDIEYTIALKGQNFVT